MSKNLTLLLLSLFPVLLSANDTVTFPTLADFWDGRAVWQMTHRDVGLPVGESDTVQLSPTHYRSYLHASYRSAQVRDQCGDPVPFPGCTTVWDSDDAGESFQLASPVCLFPCGSCPCTDERDHIQAQQYPRVAVAADGTFYMAYEWHAQTRLRTSADGVTWTPGLGFRFPSGTWPISYQPCDEVERIGVHPNIEGQADGCLVGAPPGIYIDGDMLYLFVAAGSAPGHMRCYKGNRHHVEHDPTTLTRCEHDPLFAGASDYGASDVFGAEAHDAFGFRYVSSAEVMRVGDRYYMAYEGIRGPDVLNRGWDTQFGLGFARSMSDDIDGEWEVWPNNPALQPMSPNFGIGHADLLLVDGQTIMYTATSMNTRGRYVLVWATD
jgi:hypothetical protein